MLVLGGLVEAVITVQAAARADDLDRLLGVAAALGQENGTPLSSLTSGVHHVVDLPLRPPGFVPHRSSGFDSNSRVDRSSCEPERSPNPFGSYSLPPLSPTYAMRTMRRIMGYTILLYIRFFSPNLGFGPNLLKPNTIKLKIDVLLGYKLGSKF